MNATLLARATEQAWAVRQHASVIGPTKVGAVAIAADGSLHPGCNVEHRYRSHDVHAEVNAIATMIASGKSHLDAIVIAAERDSFTPCGACMDWIFQFGTDETPVTFVNKAGVAQTFTAGELMPHYPR